MIVFGSEYRTPPGRTEPGASATYLLEHGSIAIAVAAAGVRIDPEATISTIRVLQADDDDDARGRPPIRSPPSSARRSSPTRARPTW
jgi:hypothetical protein